MTYTPHEAVRTHPFGHFTHLNGKEISEIRRWVRTRSSPGWFSSFIAHSYVATVKWDLITHYGFSEESFR